MAMYCYFGILLLLKIHSPIHPVLLKVPINHPIITRFIHDPISIKVDKNITRGTEYFVSLYANVVLSNKILWLTVRN